MRTGAEFAGDEASKVQVSLQSEVVPVTLTPTQEAGKLATIGVGGPQTMPHAEPDPRLFQPADV